MILNLRLKMIGKPEISSGFLFLYPKIFIKIYIKIIDNAYINSYNIIVVSLDLLNFLLRFSKPGRRYDFRRKT